ncbi:MAG: alpha/beta hydrolase [Polyangiales bacterium]
MAKELTHRTLEVNGIRMHVAEQGDGPLVLLAHGFPELWYSWRHQLPALAAAGYRVVAPDMRGYGDTDAPADIADYSILHLVGDLVALVAALGEKQAYIVGHDWGASVAWQAALLRPDVFPAIAALSVPARRRGPKAPLSMLRAAGFPNFYWIYFQTPGVAEAELERDPALTFRSLMQAPRAGAGSPLNVPEGQGWLAAMPEPSGLPPGYAQADLDVLVSTFRRTGFRGGLNWYRNLDRNWALTAPFEGVQVHQPSLFLAGTLDGVIRGPMGEAALRDLAQVAPGLRRKVLIDGAGHWVNEERPEEVNAELIRFLDEVRS